MKYQVHMETLLQLPKCTHLIPLTQGRAPSKFIPTTRWRKGAYKDITTRASNTPSDTAQGGFQGSLYGLQAQTSTTLWCPLWWCSWNCWGTHLCSVKQERGKSHPCTALSRRQNLHYTKISRTAAGYTSLHPDASSVFRKDFQLPERDILNVH